MLWTAYWGASARAVWLDSVQRNIKKDSFFHIFSLSFIHLYIQSTHYLSRAWILVISAPKSQGWMQSCLIHSFHAGLFAILENHEQRGVTEAGWSGSPGKCEPQRRKYCQGSVRLPGLWGWGRWKDRGRCGGWHTSGEFPEVCPKFPEKGNLEVKRVCR